MTFTGEDLKQLKDLMAMLPRGASATPLEKDFLVAFIARLEAVESLVKYADHRNCMTDDERCRCGYWKAKQVWRKVAGK